MMSIPNGDYIYGEGGPTLPGHDFPYEVTTMPDTKTVSYLAVTA